MKILHIVRQFAPSIGGLEDYVFNLSKEQIKLGHNVTVLTLNSNFQTDEKLTKEELIAGIRVRRLKWLGSKRYSLTLIKPSFLNSFDVLHVHAVDFFIDYISFLKKMRLVKPKLILTTHGGFFHTKKQQILKKIFFKTVTRFSLLSVDRVLTISPNDQALFESVSSYCYSIPNGVGLEKFGQGSKQWPSSDLVCLGRLSSNKRLDWLIHAYGDLIHPLGQLKIIGNASTGDLEALKKIIDQRGLSDRVCLLMNISDAEILQQINYSRFVVSASEYEGFGLSVIELMSYGLVPILSSTPDSFKAFVAESGVGALFDYQNDSFAYSYRQLIQSWDEDMARRAIEYSQKFAWEGICHKIMQEYQR